MKPLLNNIRSRKNGMKLINAIEWQPAAQSYEAFIFKGKLKSSREIRIWTPDLHCPACNFQNVEEDKMIEHMIGCHALREHVDDDLIEQDKDDYRLFELIPTTIYDQFMEMASTRVMFCRRAIDRHNYVMAPIDSRVGKALLAGMKPRIDKGKTGGKANFSRSYAHKVKAKMVSTDKIVTLYLCEKPMRKQNRATRRAAFAELAERLCCDFAISLTRIDDSSNSEDLNYLAGALGYKVDPIEIVVDNTDSYDKELGASNVE
ncbi:hypothetical protein Tcan_04130 [Toxocara canis]|uniref:Uncharacterized protein n=1 Tax=Toxocara canis TaxID=6265 RepID=A0A0B2VUV0_TOXCA|nr:hypothetical protein Tcan_04130 [Toxocara canis]